MFLKIFKLRLPYKFLFWYIYQNVRICFVIQKCSVLNVNTFKCFIYKKKIRNQCQKYDIMILYSLSYRSGLFSFCQLFNTVFVTQNVYDNAIIRSLVVVRWTLCVSTHGRIKSKGKKFELETRHKRRNGGVLLLNKRRNFNFNPHASHFEIMYLSRRS